MSHSEKSVSFISLRIRCAIGLLISALLIGCSSPIKAGLFDTVWNRLTGPGSLKRVSIVADQQANNTSPVAVDIVIVKEKKVFDILSNLRAGEWFNARADLLRQHQSRVFVHSWEIVPGQKIEPPDPLSNESDVVGALVFADYAGDRAYRSDISGLTTVRVLLGRDDFSVKAN